MAIVEVELEVTVRFCDDEVDVVKLPSPEYTAITENGEACGGQCGAGADAAWWRAG